MIKLIATDMDGTFLDGQHSYDRQRFRRLLEVCKAKGLIFVVASGRAYLALSKLFEEFRSSLYFIAENGSLVTAGEEVIYQSTMPPSLYLSIIESLTAAPYHSLDKLLLSGRRAAYVHVSASSTYVAHLGNFYENIQQVADFSEIEDEIFKVTTDFTVETVRQAEQSITETFPGVVAMTTGFSSIDIVLDHVDKRTGLAQLCQRLAISADEVMAFGDNLNDYQMLQFAGTAIATANAREEIKAISDQVIGPCETASVMTYLEEFLNDY